MTQEQALTILKNGANVFLTGEPGSGKTHTINRYVKYLKEHGIQPAITASTGIAATHINGVTIHSWSGIGIKKEFSDFELDRIAGTQYIAKRIKKAKVLIIDEISMLDAKALDAIDKICRRVKEWELPFGGIQTILVGDFFQLPPVAKKGETVNFAFKSEAWQKMDPVVCYLKEQHRQEDLSFLSFLSAIRSDKFEKEHYAYIDACMASSAEVPKTITKLYPHNLNVDRINDEELAKISKKSFRFNMSSSGPSALVDTIKRGCLSPDKLVLKKGATVMFTKNNTKEGFVNGTLGKVVGFDVDTRYPVVKTTSGYLIETYPMEWKIEENGRVRARITQIPLKLAWAITVHKSQGMSLDAALMDLSRVFEFGQGYVALSRVRTLDGLFLLGLNDIALKVHPEILKIDKNFKNYSEITAYNLDSISLDTQNEKQQLFIKICGGKKLDEVGKKLNKVGNKKSTLDETLRLFKAGKNVSEIAKERGVIEGTILTHIEKLIGNKKIKKQEFKKIIDIRLRKELLNIADVFEALDTDRLTLVYNELDGKFTYDELRVARMFIE